MNELLYAFLLYLQAEGPPPPVRVVEHAKTVQMYPSVCSFGCFGMFDPSGVVYLSDQVDLSTLAGRSVLLHELRHWQQWKTCGGPAYSPGRRDEREFDAYCLQQQWLQEQRAGTWVVAPGIEPQEFQDRCESQWRGRIRC